MDYLRNTAPCGIDCFNCELHETRITEKFKAYIASAYKMDPEKVTCKGCREQGGCSFSSAPCLTRDCVTAKGLDFCHECGEFPCGRLLPVAERADKVPHNLKLFNLCRIAKVGVDEWAKDAASYRKLYFQGKFVIGAGPVAADEKA